MKILQYLTSKGRGKWARTVPSRSPSPPLIGNRGVPGVDNVANNVYIPNLIFAASLCCAKTKAWFTTWYQSSLSSYTGVGNRQVVGGSITLRPTMQLRPHEKLSPAGPAGRTCSNYLLKLKYGRRARMKLKLWISCRSDDSKLFKGFTPLPHPHPYPVPPQATSSDTGCSWKKSRTDGYG